MVDKRNRSRVDVICSDCGKTRKVRSDSLPAKRCRSCANRNNGAKASRKKRGQDKKCLSCDKVFYVFPSELAGKKYCSPGCANDAKRVYKKITKSCLYCNDLFVFSEKPHSNSSGNYCSIKCRNDAYAKNSVSYGYKGFRPRWRSARNRFIEKNNNFCFECHAEECRLYVHHINPYRNTKDNSEDNLITLCGKCHSAHEKISDKIVGLPLNLQSLAVSIIQARMQDSWHLYHGRKILNGSC